MVRRKEYFNKMNNTYEMKIAELISKVLGMNVLVQYKPDKKLIDLDLDSISFIKLIVELENEFDIEFSDKDLNIKKYSTIKQFMEKIEYMLESEPN